MAVYLRLDNPECRYLLQIMNQLLEEKIQLTDDDILLGVNIKEKLDSAIQSPAYEEGEGATAPSTQPRHRQTSWGILRRLDDSEPDPPTTRVIHGPLADDLRDAARYADQAIRQQSFNARVRCAQQELNDIRRILKSHCRFKEG